MANQGNEGSPGCWLYASKEELEKAIKAMRDQDFALFNSDEFRSQFFGTFPSTHKHEEK